MKRAELTENRPDSDGDSAASVEISQKANR